jgi:pimeloyl-ACP methyl ester carboxylesterase
MNNDPQKSIFWRLCIFVFHVLGLPFQMSPTRIPKGERDRLAQATGDHDAIVIFNAGGFGDFPLEKAADFASVLNGIQGVIQHLGYRSTTVVYRRVDRGLSGKLFGTKEQLNSFRLTSQIQISDLAFLCHTFHHKKFILVGFSIGGGLSARTLAALKLAPNLLGITVGVPFWFQTYASPKSLVLNNDNLDPLCTGNFKIIAANVIRSPWVWLKSRFTGEKISLALAFKFPYHDYPWSSPRIGIPIRRFLEEELDSPELVKGQTTAW